MEKRTSGAFDGTAKANSHAFGSWIRVTACVPSHAQFVPPSRLAAGPRAPIGLRSGKRMRTVSPAAPRMRKFQ